MEIIKSNVKYFKWQTDLIKGIFKNPTNTIHVVKSSRQKGKSVVAETIILKFAIDKPHSFSIYVSPTLKQSRKVFKEVKNAVEDSNAFFKANESLLEIIFRNGSTIQFLSAEQKEGLRGYTVSGLLVLDESAFISDEIFNILLPLCDANKAPMLIISTPLYRTGFFYDFYMDGLDPTNHSVFSYDWSAYDTSEILSPERLEFYRQRMPADKFKNEYLGEFTDLGTGIFGDVSSIINNSPRNDLKCYMGIDWATGTNSDETSITIFNSERQMIYIEGFNDKDETETIDRIIEIINEYNPSKIQVELNSIGRIFYGLLQKKINSTGTQTHLKGFNTSNESKRRIVENFQVAVQNKECTILKDEKLLLQMSQFESTLTGTGKVTYAASKSGHDDRVLSTLLAYDAINNGTYNIG